jgi:hypothetical protein
LGELIFPTQSYPVAGKYFKALVFLSPGPNLLNISLDTPPWAGPEYVEIPTLLLSLTYVPLLQAPPLHLAIMIAKNSPLLIDCPPAKSGGLSTAHADLQAAIAKFRMTAYMWQALTAENMRAHGLGRRSFRFDEEWTVDTVSQDFLNAASDGSLAEEGSASSAMRSTAKINLIRSDETIAVLRDPNVAQQNPLAGDSGALHRYFISALEKHGGPFDPERRPIVAGLILDSHYSVKKEFVLAHAALGSHNACGTSLGMMGSHLTYSWPRFLEEVAGCLTDPRDPGLIVRKGNDNFMSMWEPCADGQSAFLHQVGHAFGLPHRAGIMEREYAVHWPRNFLPFTAYCASQMIPGLPEVTNDTENTARWNLNDALFFSHQPHFRLPDDQLSRLKHRDAVLDLKVNQEAASLSVTCGLLGVARILLQGITQPAPRVSSPALGFTFYAAELEKKFNRADSLKMHILGMNGKEKTIENVWEMFHDTFINTTRVPSEKGTV